MGDVNLSSTAVGNGGHIRITTGFFSLTNGARMTASTRGRGNAGNVILNARDRVALDNKVVIFSSVCSIGAEEVCVDEGGDIRITTGSLSLTNGAPLVAETLGQGDAGNVVINARDRVALDNSMILSSVGASNSNTTATGNGGNIRIAVGSLSLNEWRRTRCRRSRSNITLNARGDITVEGVNRQESASAITSSTEQMHKDGAVISASW